MIGDDAAVLTDLDSVRIGSDLDRPGLSVFPCAGGGLNITPQWLL